MKETNCIWLPSYYTSIKKISTPEFPDTSSFYIMVYFVRGGIEKLTYSVPETRLQMFHILRTTKALLSCSPLPHSSLHTFSACLETCILNRRICCFTMHLNQGICAWIPWKREHFFFFYPCTESQNITDWWGNVQGKTQSKMGFWILGESVLYKNKGMLFRDMEKGLKLSFNMILEKKRNK